MVMRSVALVAAAAALAPETAATALSNKQLLATNEVMSMLKSRPEPEALAVELMEAASQSAQDFLPSCSASSGYDHCVNCALPTINELANQLVVVKSEIWAAQKARAASANTVCTEKYPADRTGGSAKCCSGSGTVSYAPFAYTACTADNFDAAHDPNTEPALIRTDDKGFFLPVDTVSSKMTVECCSATSTCRTNTDNYDASMREKMRVINAHWAQKVKDRDEKNAASDKFVAVTAAHAARKVTLMNICKVAADPSDINTDQLIARPATVADARANCLAGSHIRDIADREGNRADNLENDLQAIQRAIDVINQVKLWLKDNGSELFSDRATTTEPGVATYAGAVALLEEAKTSDKGNKLAGEALEKVSELLEAKKAGDNDSGAHGGTAAGTVIALIDEILQKLAASKQQTASYEVQMVKDEAAEIATLYKELHSVWTEYVADVSTLAGLQLQATNFMDPESDTMLDNYKDEWIDLWKLREENTRKCMQFMTYYDSETLTNTGELLILKKAIDIIKNIGCGPNHLQTTSPTEAVVVPTLAPTPAPTPRCQTSEDAAQTALFSGVEGNAGESGCVWTALTGSTKRECETNCLTTKFDSATDTQQCLAMRFATGSCQMTQVRNCDIYASVIGTGESIISRDCFDIQQGGSLGTVNEPDATYYPVCNDAEMETVVLTNGVIVANTYREFPQHWACNEAGVDVITNTADQTRAQCKALCDASGVCRAYETTVDTHAHIDADTGVEHIAGDCTLYSGVNNFVDVTTTAGNRQCYTKIDGATVGAGDGATTGIYSKIGANDFQMVDGSNTFFMYKDSADSRWKITSSATATTDQVYYWGPDSASAHAGVEGPPPASRWTAGEAAFNTAPPSVVTCAAAPSSCIGGTYQFMLKASQLGATYEVPEQYTTASFNIGATTSEVIADGACTTLDSPVATSHYTNKPLTHQYKCCDGQMYGAIGTGNGTDLCASQVGDLASQCTVFGANMYRTNDNAVDPSLQCTGNQHFSALSGTCADNVCVCNTGNGVAVADADCTAHGNEQCGTCGTGYHSEYVTTGGVTFTHFVQDTATIPCAINTCKCPDGPAFVDADPTTGTCAPDGNTIKCDSCNSGWTLSAAGVCEMNQCSCSSAGITIGVAASGPDCTDVSGDAMVSTTQKCMSCNTGFTHDAAASSCLVVDPCTNDKDVCNQANFGNTCAIDVPAADTKNRPFRCTCTGNFSEDSDCQKCDPGFVGHDCATACTNMKQGDASYKYNPDADTAFSNAVTCSFTCEGALTHTAGADVCA
jgi:hypothetical protein